MRYTDETIFKVGSTYSRHHLKRRLIRFRLVPYKCQCGNIGEWEGKPLVLQIDHINGVSSDNRLENLRFICPNCHAQTATYAGKNSIGVRPKIPKPNARAEKRKRDLALWEILKTDQHINVGVWGWKGRLAEKLGIRSQKVSQWLQRVVPEFEE